MPPDATYLEQARQFADDPETVECLWLVRNGVPFDVAFSLDSTERLGWVVIFGRFEGGAFNWTAGRWEQRDA